MKPIKDLGMLFPNENSNRQRRYGLFKCGECGIEFKSQISKKTNDSINMICGSCGKVIGGKSNIKHGDARNRLYRIFCNMKSRCNNNNVPSYVYYGARGIKVKWNNFEDFKSWSLLNGYRDN